MFGALKNRLKKFIGKVEEEEKKKEEVEVEEPVDVTTEEATTKEVTNEEVKEEKPEKEKEEPKPKPEIKEPKQLKKPEKSKKTKKKREVKLTAKSKVLGLFRRTIKFSENDLRETFDDLQMDLLQSDVAYETTDAILEELAGKLINREIDKSNMHNFIINSIQASLLDVLRTEKCDLLNFIKNSKKPVNIIFLGINGTGKTTTIAKVAKYLMNNGFSVVLAAGDTFRAGAIEQLEIHGRNLGVKVIKHKKGADAAATIYDAVEHAKARNIDVVLADSAGRMQTNVNLMEEMKKIIRVNKPDLKLFVGEALTGNDAVEQARTFNDNIGIDGVILTKMDADAKGGCAISIAYEIKKPILFVGVGQGYDDLMEFDDNWFVGEIV